jgi:hypothetical protein
MDYPVVVGDQVEIIAPNHEAKGQKGRVDFIYHDGTIHLKVPGDERTFGFDLNMEDVKKNEEKRD